MHFGVVFSVLEPQFLCIQAEKVKEKVYGKQKVYLVDQSLISSANDPDITQMDSRIFELTKQVAEDSDVINKAEKELKLLNSTLTIEEASAQLNTVFSFFNAFIF